MSGTDAASIGSMKTQDDDSEWILKQEGFSDARERERETLFTIGNGYCGIRGACNIPLPSSSPDLFIAGVYDAKVELLPYFETSFLAVGDRDEPYPELVSFPFPFGLRLWFDHVEWKPSHDQLSKYERKLNFKQACLSEQYEIVDPLGQRTLIRTFRCASLSDPHLLLQEVVIRPINHSSHIEINASLDDPDIRIRHPHLKTILMEHGSGFSDALLFETKHSKIKVYIAARTELNGQECFNQQIVGNLEEGKDWVMRRLVSIYTSRDTETPEMDARKHLRSLELDRFEFYLQEQKQEWDRFWDISDIQIKDGLAITQMLRFNLYHLRIAAPIDETISIGARTLSGRAYEGHIFWDAEVFMLPVFLYTHPTIARNMLGYRHRTLGGAKERAKRLGYDGACYAWESTVSGLDATPKTIHLGGTDVNVPIFTGRQQIHVTGSVAHSIYRYWQVTGDDDWMKRFGAEIMIEVARFWRSRVSFRSNEFHIDGVVGPDEYHHNVNDNAYTNWLARSNLIDTIEMVNRLMGSDKSGWDELSSKLKIQVSELKAWQDTADRMYFPKPNADGVYPQFEGFFDLNEVAIRSKEKFKPPFERLLNWEAVNSSKILKQADFLMIPFLSPNAFSIDQIRKNFYYYEKLTDHGSSLSPCVHSAIAARIGENDYANRYWEVGLKLDLQNLMNNTSHGFHAAAAGGTWQALVFHALGIPVSGEELPVPNVAGTVLPARCDTVFFNLVRRNQMFRNSVHQRDKRKVS